MSRANSVEEVSAPRREWPSDSREAAKLVIRDIVAAAGGRLAGKTRLFKAFYAAHLYYWRGGNGVLTDYPIVRMPRGPGIDDGEELLLELEREGFLRIGSQPCGPFEETVYESVGQADFEPDDPRFRAAQDAAKWVRDKTAVELSAETHEFSRSWNESSDGDEMNIYLDLVPNSDLIRIRESVKRAEDLVNGAFKQRA